MNKLVIDKERCKACGFCISVCPKKVIETDKDELNTKGYHPIKAARQEDCIGCGLCAAMCPDVVIEIYGEGGNN